jgi:hypothetical protein
MEKMDLERSSCDIIELLSRHLPVGGGGLRKTMKNFAQDSHCPWRDSNGAPPEYESAALLLQVNKGYHSINLPTYLTDSMEPSVF